MTDSSPPSLPDGPRRATLRARTRTGRVRPEVIDALDELERSLGDVARWEQLLSGSDPKDDWDNPASFPGGRGRLLELDADDFDEIDVLEEADSLPKHLERAIVSLDDRLDEIDPPDPLLHFSGDLPAPSDPVPVSMPIVSVPDPSTSLLWQARTVEPAARAPIGDEADRRRRNGRVLTWTGIALLLALGALWVLPKQDSGDKLENEPLVTVTVTAPVTSSTLFAPFATSPTVPTTLPAVVQTTPTTKGTTKATTKATTKPTAPPVTNSTLLNPGPGTTAATTPPSSDTTTTSPTTTTSTTTEVTPPSI